MAKNTRATNQPREPERMIWCINRTGPYTKNVAMNGTTITKAIFEYHGPKSHWFDNTNASVGRVSNAHATQKSQVTRNGRSIGSMR